MRKKNKIYTIYAERSSVCMGDDVNAPNAEKIPYRADECLSEFFAKITDYIPNVNNAEWVILSASDEEVAYIRFRDGKYECIAANESRDIYVYELGGRIFCMKK